MNILGLSTALACSSFIWLWVSNEISYDSFHAKSERIMRVAGIFTDESGTFTQAVTPIPLAAALKVDLPEIEQAVRIDKNDATVRLDDVQFVEQDILGVDPSFFDVFDFQLLRGSAANALNDPYTIVLSASMAEKYFGKADPIGKTLRIFLYDENGEGADYTITGIVEDAPQNSHFHYNFLFSWKTIEVAYPESLTNNAWFENGIYTYVLVKPQADKANLSAKLHSFLEKYIGKEMLHNNFRWEYFLQPLEDIHLNSDLRYEIQATGSMSYVVIFSTIGIMVLLLAGINYVNLSTAYALQRYKEVGVRKIFGAAKKQLVVQHLAEALLLVMISFFTSLTWIEVSKPVFERLTMTNIASLYDHRTLAWGIAFACLVGLLAGTYPSFVLSSFRPISILRNSSGGVSGMWLRKGLVVFQYAITIILVVGIIVVHMQLRFIHDKDLGFDKENLLVVNVNGSREVIDNFNGFRDEILLHPDLVKVARSNSMIASGLSNGVAHSVDASGKTVNGTMYRLVIDHDYIPSYGMMLVAGRNFIEGSVADSANFIVNQATVRMLGYASAEHAVGKPFQFSGRSGEIIGVVKDFHINSLHHNVPPTALYVLNGWFSRISIRMRGISRENVERVASIWKKHFPNTVYESSFAEDRLNVQYEKEQKYSQIFVIFSCVSLIIASLGLVSLVSFSVERRTREIGIRKVLGASTRSITKMVAVEFIWLVATGCAVAVPVAWYFMDIWLQQFAFRIQLSALIFGLAIGIGFLIAFLTITIRVLYSARMNPIHAIRVE